MKINHIVNEAGTGLEIDRSVPGRTIARISGDVAYSTGAPTGKKLPDYHPDDDYTPWSGKVAASTHDDEEDTFDQDYTGDEDGELGEGVRVANQQIPGTNNRAQSAYYPSSKKITVPKLDKPLTDKELARLSQLAGIKNK